MVYPKAMHATGRTLHVRKVSVGLKRKYRAYTDDGSGRPGAVLAYAEKRLTVADAIDLYAGDEARERLAVVRESDAGFVASLTGYDVLDADGRTLASFGARPSRSVRRTTWHYEQPGVGALVGTERSGRVAVGRRVVGLLGGTGGEILNAVAKYHFDFRRDDALAFSIEKPKVLDDWYRLELVDDDLDRTAVIALAIAMEARQR